MTPIKAPLYPQVKRRFIPPSALVLHNQAMLDKLEMKRRLKEAIENGRASRPAIAAAFGITEQAVYGWITTGKIDKAKVPRLAALTGYPVSHFLPDEVVPQEAAQSPVLTPEEATHRIKTLERTTSDLLRLVGWTLTAINVTRPGAAADVAAEIRAYLAQPDKPSDILPGLMKSLEEVARRSSRGAPRKKPQRPK